MDKFSINKNDKKEMNPRIKTQIPKPIFPDGLYL